MRKQLLAFALVGVLAGVNAFAAEGVKVGGFVDGQFGWNSTTATFNTAGGFLMGDAAVRVGSEDKDSGFQLDVPVVTANSGGATPTIIFAAMHTKGQAFVHHKYSMGVNWKLGMFDTPFGPEANWSDRIWGTSPGIVWNLLPKNFIGAMIGYTSGALSVSILGANTRQTATWGTAAATTTSPDLGLVAKYGAESFNARLGFLYNSAAALGYLIDVGVGLKMGSFNADIGFDMMNPAAVSTMGIFVQPRYAFTDTIGAGVRFEFLSTTGSSTIQVTAGPDFQMSKNLKVRPQYTLRSATAATTHGAVLSAVYSL